MIKIEHVSKIFNKDNIVIDDVNLTLEEGKIIGFIGLNGAGKTTLIKSIVGIHDFDEGEILINGKSIVDNPIECKKEMAYMPDNPELYENMKAIDFINFICVS